MTKKIFTDLALAGRTSGTQTDRLRVNVQEARGDLLLVKGRQNLVQAIHNRLLTRQGELTRLGHPHYGSRLYQLIGEPNSKRTRSFAELYIRECLAMERRIKEVADVTIAEMPRNSDKRHMLEITITVIVANDQEPLDLVMTINLEK